MEQAIAGAESLIKLAPQKAYYHKLAGNLYVQNNEESKAIDAYSQAIKLNPYDEESGYAISKLLYKIELYDPAMQYVLTFLDSDNSHLGLLNLKVKILYQQKKYQQAKTVAQTLFSVSDTSVTVAKIFAVSLARTQAYDSALHMISYLEDIEQMSDVLYFQKAYCYEQLGKLDSAEVNYEKALSSSLSPNAGQYHLQLALALDQQSKYKDAIPHYKRAYEMMKNETILYYLARAYDNYYKDKSIAMNYYQRYLEESDTITTPSKIYASERISQIKTVMHMQLDSL